MTWDGMTPRWMHQSKIIDSSKQDFHVVVFWRVEEVEHGVDASEALHELHNR